jgi:uncharacterized protein
MKHHQLIALAILLTLPLHAQKKASAAAIPLAAENGADALRRRAFLGVRLDPGEGGQAVVREVFPGSSAAAAQVKAGDVLQSVNGTAVTSVAQFLSIMAAFRAGDRVAFRISRDGVPVALETTLVEWPREKSSEFEIIYDMAESGAVKLRTITTKPFAAAGKRLPAVLFIQGIDEATIESPFATPDTVRDLVHGWTRAGFVVMRCEKSGVGDSTGPPAKDCGLLPEVEDFAAALRKLKSSDSVDPNNVFIFGISAGGWVAPLVASREPAKGIMVYGTVVRPFSEYLLENHRRNKWHRQHPDPVELEQECRHMSRWLHELLVEKREREDILRDHPELSGVAKHMFSTDDTHPYGVRTVGYFREIQDQDMPRAWSGLGVPVLALVGEFEIRTSAFEHELLASIVNHRHPGLATWKQVPRTDHGMALHASLAESVENEFKGPFSGQVLVETLAWMKATMAGPSG